MLMQTFFYFMRVRRVLAQLI